MATLRGRRLELTDRRFREDELAWGAACRPQGARGSLPARPALACAVADGGAAPVPAPLRAVASSPGHGDMFTVRLHPGSMPLVLLRPSRAREGDLHQQPRDLPRQRGKAILGPIMGERSLLLQDGGARERARSC